MAVDRASFLARYPEFEPASKAMIEGEIADAIDNVDTSVFGTKTDQAVRLKAAHALALSPFGQQARLVSKSGATTYGKQFDALVRSVTPGFRVA